MRVIPTSLNVCVFHYSRGLSVNMVFLLFDHSKLESPTCLRLTLSRCQHMGQKLQNILQ